MISPTLSRLRPIAVAVLAALTLALAVYAFGEDADAKPKGGSNPTKTFTAKSTTNKGATLTLKTNRDSKGKAEITSFTATGPAQCKAGGKTVTVPMNWTFNRYPIGFSKEAKGKVGFELFEEEGNGEISEEEFSAMGTGRGNGRVAVSINRSWPETEAKVPGLGDSSTTLAGCQYDAKFVIDLKQGQRGGAKRVAPTAVARAADKGTTKTFKGGSADDPGAEMTLQTNRRNHAKTAQVSMIRVNKGNGTCKVGGKEVPVKVNRVFFNDFNSVPFRKADGLTRFEVERKGYKIRGRVLKSGDIAVSVEAEYSEDEDSLPGYPSDASGTASCFYEAGFKLSA